MKSLQEFTTDKDGKVVFPWKSEYRYLKASKGTDTAMPKQGIYAGSYGYYGDEDKVAENMTLLTDRSLYRPGQTVYVKGIAYSQNQIRRMYSRTRNIWLLYWMRIIRK